MTSSLAMGARESEQHRSVVAAWGLILAAWMACSVPLPWFLDALAAYFFASGGSGHLALSKLPALAAGPLAALGALVAGLCWCRRSGRRIAAMVLPGLLTLVELAFVVLVWMRR